MISTPARALYECTSDANFLVIIRDSHGSSMTLCRTASSVQGLENIMKSVRFSCILGFTLVSSWKTVLFSCFLLHSAAFQVHAASVIGVQLEGVAPGLGKPRSDCRDFQFECSEHVSKKNKTLPHSSSFRNMKELQKRLTTAFKHGQAIPLEMASCSYGAVSSTKNPFHWAAKWSANVKPDQGFLVAYHSNVKMMHSNIVSARYLQRSEFTLRMPRQVTEPHSSHRRQCETRQECGRSSLGKYNLKELTLRSSY